MQNINLVNLYKKIYQIRKTQEILIEEYHPADEMRCPIHFCLGQELTPSVISQFLKKDDNILSHHRSHGYYLASGAPVEEMICEFYGKENGSNGGVAGSQELSNEKYNFYSGTILSGMFAMANGTAFADQYLSKNNISIAVIGDGGMEEGIVYETINLAAILNLPTIFICENNLFSVHSHIKTRNKITNFYKKAESFGIKSIKLNQENPLIFFQKFKNIFEYCKKNKKPIFVEVDTYRFGSHVGPENDLHMNYRSDIEIKKWRKKDPVLKIRNFLSKKITDLKIKKYEYEINNSIYKGIELAKKSNFPKFKKVLENNFQKNKYKKLKKINKPTFFDTKQNETKLNPY